MANIDPMFAGQATFAITAENEVEVEVEVEEAYIRTRALGNGLNIKAGRFMSGIGYLNSLHSHAWDFVDAPFAYQAFFGGQYKPDGVQARWLAPTDTFLEFGAELASGRIFPGNERNKNGVGATTVFANAGDDIGDSASWRAGLSYLRTRAVERGFEDAVWKWAPGGNPTRQSVKLQGEWMQRRESGELAALEQSAGYRSRQSGWYLQGVYQFAPGWRVGLRDDRLSSGSTRIGLVDEGVLGAADLTTLSAYAPRGTLEAKPGVEPGAAHLGGLLAQLKGQPAKMVIRAAYQDPRASQWLSERAGIPAVALPYTVGADAQSGTLFALFDTTVARLPRTRGRS